MTDISANSPATKLLVLGAAAENIPFIKYLLEQGLHVVCTDRHPSDDAYTEFAKFGDAFKCYAIDFSNDNEIDALVENEHITHTIPLPIGRALVCLGRINDKFGFAGASFRATDTLTDKISFHKFCEDNALNHCKYMVIPHPADNSLRSSVAEIEATLAYPFLVKPALGSGSTGVIIINSREELLAYRIPERFNTNELLIEELIEGTEYSCSIIVDAQGNPTCMGLFAKFISKPPYRQETVYFSDDYTETYKVIEPVIKTLCKQLQLKSCFINSDIIVTEHDEPFIIDISPRLGGNSILDLLTYNGNNPLHLYKRCMLDGFKPEINPQKVAAMGFFDFADNFSYEGVTSLMTGQKSADPADIAQCFNYEDKELILNLVNNVKAGDHLGPMQSGNDVYRGHLTVKHDSTDCAYEMICRYLNAMQ